MNSKGVKGVHDGASVPLTGEPEHSEKPVLMVSTVGTALLTNPPIDDATRSSLSTLANYTAEQLDQQQRELIDSRAEAVLERLVDANHQEWQKASAEVNGILSYANAAGRPLAADDYHILLTSDTYQGCLTATMVEDFLKSSFPCRTEIYTPPHLCTRDRAAFSHGMADVIRWCEDTLPGYQDAGYRVVFNLTGGFKSIQGYMNTLGMLYADEIIYIFEPPTRELIVIPRLPIKLTTGDVVRRHAVKLGVLAHAGQLPLEEVADIPQSFLEIVTVDKQEYAAMSLWGLAVWERSRKEVFGAQLIQWPQMIYKDSFRNDFAAHTDKNLRASLQDALAKASAHLNGSGDGIGSLRRDGGLNLAPLHGHDGIEHFRITGAFRVTCEIDGQNLLLRRFGAHNINNNP